MDQPLTCTVVDYGRDCRRPVLAGSHLSVCARHMQECADHVRDVLTRTAEQHPSAVRQIARALGAAPVPVPYPDAARISVVYYIAFADRVKIGTSANPRARLTALPYDEVLAFEPGDAAMERQRHRQFVRHRVHNEWFTAHEEVLRHARRLRDRYGEPWEWLRQQETAAAETASATAAGMAKRTAAVCPSCDLLALVVWPDGTAQCQACQACQASVTAEQLTELVRETASSRSAHAKRPRTSGVPGSAAST